MIDVNSDVGEMTQLLEDGTYYKLMDYITSINIACGGHAGDHKFMKTMVRMGIEKNVNVGAHPSYPDKENFGRKIIPMKPPYDQVPKLIADTSAPVFPNMIFRIF